MKKNSILRITALGQVGYLFEFGSLAIVIDPYLSDYVEDIYGDMFKRQVPAGRSVSELPKIDMVLISHLHEDHCDPITLSDIYKKNPNCKFVCPQNCGGILNEIGVVNIEFPMVGEKIQLNSISIKTVPSSHTELVIKNGLSDYNGYEIDFGGYIVYHPGDTIPFEELKDYISPKIDLAFLPINERNYFRDRSNIVGNMTCREALQWSKELNIKKWVPTHWDVFEGNSTNKEELEIIAKDMNLTNYFWMNSGESLELSI